MYNNYTYTEIQKSNTTKVDIPMKFEAKLLSQKQLKTAKDELHVMFSH